MSGCKQPTSEEMQSGTEHWEVIKEHAAVKPVGLRKQHWGRNLAPQRCQELKEQTWGDCGFRRKFVAARIWMTHCAGVAMSKGNAAGKVRARDNVV
jgi:hypothetical protein